MSEKDVLKCKLDDMVGDYTSSINCELDMSNWTKEDMIYYRNLIKKRMDKILK